MDNFGLIKTPFRRPRRYEFIDGLNVKSDLRIKSYGLGEFKQRHFISVQSCLLFLPESNPRPYINIVLRAKENPSPNTLILRSKTLEKTPKNLEHRIGSF